MELLIVNKILAVSTLGMQVLILAGIFYLLFFRQKRGGVFIFFNRHGIGLAFIIALLATGGSLFYSNIAGFAPCDLCWLQRIFMYPQVVLLGLAWMWQDKKIINYSLALAIVGSIISLYHNYISYTGNAITSCVVGGTGVSCIGQYVVEFGYITIPLMALTGFLALILIFIFQKLSEGKE